MNGVDRHYLFRLSDALKRRFAFIEVGVSEQLGDEWKKVLHRCELKAADLDDVDRGLHDELRRFVYLVRAFYPVGTAQLLAAVRFLIQSRHAGLSPDARLYQALAGSILPGLEDAPRELLWVLQRWSETRNADHLAAALKKAPALYLVDRDGAARGAEPQVSAQLRGMVAQLEELQLVEPAVERQPAPDEDTDVTLVQRFTHLVARRRDPDELPRLRAHLSAMARA
jgi:hypothetical protein